MSPSDNNFTRGLNSLIVPFIGATNTNNNRPPSIPITSTITGTLSFAATLSLSTLIQAKLFHISTGTVKPIPTLFGLGSVALASLVCHYVSIQTFQIMTNSHSIDYYSSSFMNYSSSPIKLPTLSSSLSLSSNTNQLFKSFHKKYIQFNANNINNIDDISHSIRVILLGLIAYKGLGGRFWSVSPSSYTHLGSFARRVNSLPARSDAYATFTERQMIGKLGRVLGCHTCGNRMIMKKGLKNGTKFIGKEDH